MTDPNPSQHYEVTLRIVVDPGTATQDIVEEHLHASLTADGVYTHLGTIKVEGVAIADLRRIDRG